MNNEQYKKIARKITGTTLNVYQIAGGMFGYDWTDDDFDNLELITGVFRCEQCDHWMLSTEKDKDIIGWCKACVDKLDEEANNIDDEE